MTGSRAPSILDGFRFGGIDAENVRARIAHCDHIERQDVLEALGHFASPVVSREPLHLLGSEGLPGPTVVIASLTEPLVEFGGEVKRAEGEVECIKAVFTAVEEMNR